MLSCLRDDKGAVGPATRLLRRRSGSYEEKGPIHESTGEWGTLTLTKSALDDIEPILRMFISFTTTRTPDGESPAFLVLRLLDLDESDFLFAWALIRSSAMKELPRQSITSVIYTRIHQSYR